MSIHADEFVPIVPVADIGFDSVQSANIAQPEPYIQNEQFNKNETIDFMQHEQPLMAADEPRYEQSPDLLNLSAEPKPEPEIPIAQPIEPEPVAQPEPKPEPVIEDSSFVSEAAVVGAAIAATTAAVAAAAVGVAKATSTAAKAKPTDAKKTDLAKGKPAPIRRPTGAATSKVAPKSTATKVEPKAVASKVAPRTSVTSKVTSTTERKPITSTTTRKPLSNGSE